MPIGGFQRAAAIGRFGTHNGTTRHAPDTRHHADSANEPTAQMNRELTRQDQLSIFVSS
jgi:hypothetical protein